MKKRHSCSDSQRMRSFGRQIYRPVSLTSVVWKPKEHVIADYIRQVWEDKDWLYEG